MRLQSKHLETGHLHLVPLPRALRPARAPGAPRAWSRAGEAEMRFFDALSPVAVVQQKGHLLEWSGRHGGSNEAGQGKQEAPSQGGVFSA